MEGVILSLSMTPLMCLEILLAEFAFAIRFPRRDYFWARFIGSSVVAIYITVWIELIYGFLTGTNFNYISGGTTSQIVFKIIYYVLIFSMSVFCIWFSFKQSLKIVLINCSLGYAMQFLSFNIVQVFNLFWSDKSSIYYLWFNLYFSIIACGGVYTIISLFIIKSHPHWDQSDRNNRNKIFLFLTAVLMCIGLSRLSVDDVNKSILAGIVEPIAFILISMLIILFQFSLADNEQITKELATTKVLLHQEHTQYALTKENIEIINEKCHDLKHQISLLRENTSEKKIAEIEKAVMIYDSTIKTGNDVLDILLSEKKLQCDSKKIQFTLVVNGKLLSFMEDMDLYSLFGNAISNAMESVSELDDIHKRHISLKVREVGDLVSIHVENYFSGDIQFENKLPKTKKDTTYHGYGMKSMERIVTSYGGTLNVTIDNGLFKLDVLLPKQVQFMSFRSLFVSMKAFKTFVMLFFYTENERSFSFIEGGIYGKENHV